MIPEEYDWMQDAACRGMNPDLFFAQRPQDSKEPYQLARQVCASCPVRLDCLEAGMKEKHGLWGGLSEDQRAAVRRKRRLARRSVA